VLLCACATPGARALRESPGDLPPRADVSGVPFFAQEELQCGPAALAMALGWSGLPVTPAELAPQVYTEERQGSLQLSVVSAARRAGRLAVQIRGLRELFAELAAGNPVIVLQNLGLDWWQVWHYAVAVGYDLEKSVVILSGGARERRELPLSTFERTWRRAGEWGLVVTPPDRPPALRDAERLRAAREALARASAVGSRP
jgi:ABC-type bacteriocin/lantibiotic exporter with double-glycine peptidase domain